MSDMPNENLSAIEIPDNLLTRRQFIRGGIACTGLLLLPGVLAKTAHAAVASLPPRSLTLHNLHTAEKMRITYREAGRYLPDALAHINHLMRDFRSGESYPMDIALLDLIAALHQRLETNAPFEIISGYRSPATNSMLHQHSGGVAKKSLHMEGKALDIRVPGRDLSLVHKTALVMGLGGVGYYPSSDFVHVDTGRIRQWQGA